MTADLLPCPFCGTANLYNAHPSNAADCGVIACRHCGCEGPDAGGEDGHIAAWNIRAALETVTSHDDHPSCDVCGRHFHIDTVVSHELWESIKPDPNSAQGCGMLCAGCMADKISKVTDWAAICMANIALEPATPPVDASYVDGWMAGREEALDALIEWCDRNDATPGFDIELAKPIRELFPPECASATPPDVAQAVITAAKHWAATRAWACNEPLATGRWSKLSDAESGLVAAIAGMR